MSGLWTLRRRIVAAIILLLVLTVGLTLVVLERKMRDAAARGDYLKKHLSRFLTYQEALGESLLASAQVMAADASLAAALDSGNAQALEQVRERFQRIVEQSPYGGFVAALTRDFAVAFENPSGPGLGASTRVLASTSRGVAAVSPVQLKSGAVYLLATAPVLSGDRQAGTLLLGVDLGRVFRTYSTDSDSDREKRHQLCLVAGDEVVASTLKEEVRGDWLAGWKGKFTVQEGSLTATVLSLDGRNFDLTETPFPGLAADGGPVIGTLVLFRVREAYESRVTENLYPVVYVGAGALAAAILVALLLSGTITRPIRRFTVSLRQLAEGEADLTVRVPVSGRDELAALGHSVNALIERVLTLVVHIRDASLRLGQSAQEISHVSTRTFEGARGQLDRIENSTSLTNELSRTIQEISSRATQGASVAGLGTESVEKSEAGMTRIRETVHGSWDKVVRLKESVDKIGSIAELISKITDENSMLALNASIEAARAGSAGQGFAVVAQQMREQARRVERSSREIIQNISAILRITQDLVASMEGSRSDVERGTQLVTVTLHHLSELSAIMQETAESVKEQAAASDDIAQMMLEIQRIGREALEASQQTVDEGHQIRDRARDLAGLVGRFRVQELPAAQPGLPALPGNATTGPQSGGRDQREHGGGAPSMAAGPACLTGTAETTRDQGASVDRGWAK